MQGVFHPYYSLTLAPPTAALAGAGLVALWRRSVSSPGVAWLLGGLVTATAAWSAVVLGRTPDFAPGLATAVAIGGAVAGLAIPLVRSAGPSAWWATAAVAGLAAAVLVAGPVAYSLASVGTDYSGGDPKAGPGETGVPAAGLPVDGSALDGDRPGADRPAADRPQAGPSLPNAPGVGRPGGGLPPGDRPVLDRPGDGPDGVRPAGSPAPWEARLEGLVDYLLADHGGETWIAAVSGSRVAAPLILETGEAVMAMGGFNGGDPTPTAAELHGYLDDGAVRFIVLTENSSHTWQAVANGRCEVVDASEHRGDIGLTVYDCSGA